MSYKFSAKDFNGIWSAMCTPLNEDLTVDLAAIPKLIEHQLKLGVRGLFIAGTSGEGPWLPDSERYVLARAVMQAVHGRIPVSMQVTDNSAERMIDNVHLCEKAGVDIVVIAPPFFQCAPTQDSLFELYKKVVDASSLPVGIYNRGKASSVFLEPETLERIISLPKVMMVKDSACDPAFTKVVLKVQKERGNGFYALNGNEFAIDQAIADGYTGMVLGGGCFNGAIAQEIFNLVKAGKQAEAADLQKHLNDIMYRVFGKNIECWMAGQKTLMVRLGVFNTAAHTMSYKLSDACSKAIDEVIKNEAKWLLP